MDPFTLCPKSCPMSWDLPPNTKSAPPISMDRNPSPFANCSANSATPIRVQFLVYWQPGITNLADYHTKHQSPDHHRLMRSTYLHPTEQLANTVIALLLRGCVNPPVRASPFRIILLSPFPCFAGSVSCLSHKVCQPNLIKLVTTYFKPTCSLRLHISIFNTLPTKYLSGVGNYVISLFCWVKLSMYRFERGSIYL